MALTADIPLIRLADGDIWSVMLVRSALTLLGGGIIWLILRRATGKAPSFMPGRTGFLIVVIYGLGALTFIGAVYNTTTANLVFILAFNTVFSALLSWWLLGERPHNWTLVAMAVMFVGVLVIVGDGLGSGHFLGDMLALANSFLLALAITVSRGSDEDMGLTSVTAVLFPLALGALMLALGGGEGAAAPGIAMPWWIVLNGLVVMPIAYYCLAAGPRFITASEVAMFYLLETVFAPIWVWMIFGEVPTDATLIGGGILVAALAAHSAWQLMRDGSRVVRA